MDENQMNMWIMSNSKFFKTEHLPIIKKMFEETKDTNNLMLAGVEFKDPMTMLIISWFGGTLGIDRFLIGDTGIGVLKLLTLGGCGIWAIIDLFLIMGATKEKNFEKLTKAFRGY